MDNDYVFYMVYSSHRTGPKIRHQDLSEAKKEAKKLCKKEGVPFFVLKAVFRYDIEHKITDTSLHMHDPMVAPGGGGNAEPKTNFG